MVERLEEENRVLKELKGAHSIVDSDEPILEKDESSKQRRKIADIDADVEINLEKVQAEAYNLDLDHQEKVLSMLDDNDEEHADTPITAAETTKVIDEVPKSRKRRGVIIQDLEETTTVTVQPKVQAKDKGKAILIEEPKPLKRQVQIDLDEEVARQLEAELNADINWNAVIKEDLESLWKIIIERFEKTEPKNFSDEYLLNTLKIMFEKPNVEANYCSINLVLLLEVTVVSEG
uniref:Uncharacterized protein n=1 Tax=Tanacetum cinerariifolium TaxID=118510 RepID=A0A6L2KFA6_TANCI|nr:hypothetical protein [Tanacetum cinerariifolium]